ncbi:MAG: hypothetical protein A3D65_04110 [Candidatus Lloydbacteria bacterium RIFCSPHIGHO2_02_FULL_50_13]|uniref:Transcriptional repressor PaaX-like central Cas2-like domain-containing protein n=1 Tax=Candidatus Lloydbacteria bacterium RIFCSPHIGHO2_02_FULL_50_13 TaxID=1798661 RepID=A0A1G2D7M7_9BACT|nr:MAG: hypothetical protein A3D65_04110 [Candidatus Lloydbacteria bacterium RIFCSPHIGHO2_02_FULL_50_13]
MKRNEIDFSAYQRVGYRTAKKRSHVVRGHFDENDKRPRRIGATQEKILLLLLGGLALGLTHSPKQYMRVVRSLKKEWKEINRRALNDAVRSLYASKLVEEKGNVDGTLTLVLSKEGKKLALTYDLDNMTIKTPTRWDRKWRIVMFDVPAGMKQLRDTLRYHFYEMGFYQFQKSVFVHPYSCASEIEYIMEFYGARRYIRFVVATEIDNVLVLKRHFKLS